MPWTKPGQIISPVTSKANARDGTTSSCDFSTAVVGADAPKTRPMAERFCFLGEPHFLFDKDEKTSVMIRASKKITEKKLWGH